MWPNRLAGLCSALMLLAVGCTHTRVPSNGPEKKSRIIWGKAVGGIRIGILTPEDELPAVMDSIECTYPVTIYIQNESLNVPKGSDGTVRMAIWSWQIGEINPGTAGGMWTNKRPPDARAYPLKAKLLDGRVHPLRCYFLDGSSVCPQESLSGDITLTLFHTDAQGRYLGNKWSGRLKTGNALITYEYEDSQDP